MTLYVNNLTICVDKLTKPDLSIKYDLFSLRAIFSELSIDQVSAFFKTRDTKNPFVGLAAFL